MNKWTAIMAAMAVTTSLALAHNHGEKEDAGEAAADVYEIDKAHSVVGFSVRHLGIVNVRGTFGEYDGEISMVGDDLSTLSINATIQVASIDTGNNSRDDHLRNEDYFEVDAYPELTFVSSGVVSHGDGYGVSGALTIKGVTRAVTLPITISGPVEAWGSSRIGLEIRGSVNRHDFGVANDALADRSIGDAVNFDIQIQAIKQ